ncbi:hypothetical protein D9611_005054 [Ephemerocybe angulata]|uniref:DUF7598 domain-containing protein n=1 Tax=Ephemerocybe angulata TaxID=980116 RepID=A0A8H5B3Z4_9AGAR|nr:hypothetical protein D9611_005054 [Tulosesus angulatus]
MAPNTRTMFFFGLNAVRVLSIVSLILVFASSILVMVTNIKAVNAFQANKINNTTESDMVDCDYIEGSTVPNQAAGVFWAVVASLLIIFQSIVLLLSECSWPMAFFDKFFPVLGTKFGLGALGIFQCLIATQILSHHVDDFTLVSAFFLFALGCVNMLLGLIFRAAAKQKRSIRGWREQGKDVLPTTSKEVSGFHPRPFHTRGSIEKIGFPVPQDRDDASIRSTEKAPAYSWPMPTARSGGLGEIANPQIPQESRPRFAPTLLGASVTRSNTTASTESTATIESFGHDGEDERRAPSPRRF